MIMFNIGDEVMIIEDADGYCPYSITTPGTIGIIIDFNNEEDGIERVKVKWYTFTSYTFQMPQTYSVDPTYLKLTDESKATSSGKYFRIIRKMKQMEAKRKALGYKTYGTI
jgi:hypothetical protein